MRVDSEYPGSSKFKEKVHEVIFEAETPAGKAFDVILLILIVVSVLAVVLETIQELNQKYHMVFIYLEWIVTVLFTIEYLLRLYCVLKPWKYATSFFGIIDLLAILPTYISLLIPGSQYFLTIRVLRVLRIFRIFKIARYLDASRIIVSALKASKAKIIVFLVGVLTIVIVVGSMMYFIESSYNSGFSSIPMSMYWAVVTLTTVGFGDITPVTHLGQFLSALLMIMGYGIIAVPTGIVTAEFAMAARDSNKFLNTISCHSCGQEGHAADATYCKYCGVKL